MMDTSIADFFTSFYIPEIQKIAFHLPHMLILGTHYYSNTFREAFKCCRVFKNVLCSHDYSNRLVSSFSRPIQFEYYDRNRAVSIKVIALDHSIATIQLEIASALES